MIDVSIIVVNWNVRDLLRLCLQSLRDQAGLPMSQMQVIVVDNASADGSAAMVSAEFPEVMLLAMYSLPGVPAHVSKCADHLPLCRLNCGAASCVRRGTLPWW